MHEQNMAILKSLVSVAWADGHVAEEEREVIEALLQAFDASPAETQIIRDYAAEPKSLDDVPVTDLSADDRRVLLQHAVLLSYIDGEQHETELQMLKDLSTKLRIPEGERDDLMKAAGERAKSFLNLLLAGGRSALSPRPSAVSQTGGPVRDVFPGGASMPGVADVAFRPAVAWLKAES